MDAKQQVESDTTTQGTTNITEIIEAIAERVDPIIKLLTVWTERAGTAEETRAKYTNRMAWVAVFVVSFVITVAGILTGLEKIDGSTFTFLLGLVVGYVLTFVRESIGAGTRKSN